MVTGTERTIAVRWRERSLFDAMAPGRPAILVDGDGAAAVSPVELLLVAAATCTATDVVSILAKQRVTLERLDVAASGTRREDHPRRYTAIHLHFTVAGAGAELDKARRAIDLSLEKYCSVVASLAPDLRIAYDVTIG